MDEPQQPSDPAELVEARLKELRERVHTAAEFEDEVTQALTVDEFNFLTALLRDMERWDEWWRSWKLEVQHRDLLACFQNR
jgi:transposase